MFIDAFFSNILKQSSLSEEEVKLEMAKYAMACIHDTKLAEEAAKICEAQDKG